MKLNLFQLSILGVFVFFILFAVLVFSGVLPLFKNNPTGVGGTVMLWGTVPAGDLRVPLETLNDANGGIFKIEYEEKNQASFDQELVEALASGRGPDLILLPQDLIIRHAGKIAALPFTSMSERDFRDTFIEEGELYIFSNGILALPFTIDPLVLYWNRDIFSRAGVASPPTAWDELFTLVPKLTKEDAARNITQAGAALGEYRNIRHAKDILATLIMQAGNPILAVSDGKFSVVLKDALGFVTSPAESALRFYTEFSNPVKPIYTWNRSLPSSDDSFVAGDLALYIGFASERGTLEEKSPHLNFDIARIPQTRDVGVAKTFGKMTGVAVLRNSDNIRTAYAALIALTEKSFIKSLAEENGLPPVRRDLLSSAPKDRYGEVFYKSALISGAWLDPSPLETEDIFRELIEDVVSGRQTVGSATKQADKEIENLFK